jgi:hypothetical protein
MLLSFICTTCSTSLVVLGLVTAAVLSGALSVKYRMIKFMVVTLFGVNVDSMVLIMVTSVCQKCALIHHG